MYARNTMEPKDVIANLKKIPMFRDLADRAGEDALLRLVPHVAERVYEADENLFTQGETPDRLCLIISGHVAITHTQDDGTVTPGRTKQAGDVLGRTGLAVNQYEDVTAQATEETHVLYLLFREFINKVYDQSDELRQHLSGPLQSASAVQLLKTIPLFADLQDDRGEMELYRIAKLVHDQVYGNGEWLFRQGEISDRLVLVVEGRIQLTKIDAEGLVREVGWLEVGDVAGETGLLVGDFHDVLATADAHARVLFLLREDFAKLLEERPRLFNRLRVSTTVEGRHKARKHDWLRDDEWVIIEVKRHWSRLARQVTVPIIFLILLASVLSLLIASETEAIVVLGVIVGFIIIVLSAAIGWQYLNWRDDFFVLTTQRVVHIERAGPFSTDSEESPLDNIQDVYEVQQGITANILNFGNLVLQTAGETVDIDMDNIPNPSRLRELIFQQIERTKARDLLRARGQIRDLLARRLHIEKAPPREELEGAAPKRTQRRMWFLLPISWLWDYLFPPSWLETDGGGTIVLRRYWLPGILRYVGAFLPLLLLTVFGGRGVISLMGTENLWWAAIAWLAGELIFTGAFLYIVEDWRNDYVQITPSHIIQVERSPLLLSESRREARLDRIQNLSFQVPDIIAQILKYGHVQFETAGREGKFELKYVRNPAKVRAKISDRQYEYSQRQRRVDALRRQDELLSWFATYDNLRKERGS